MMIGLRRASYTAFLEGSDNGAFFAKRRYPVNHRRNRMPIVAIFEAETLGAGRRASRGVSSVVDGTENLGMKSGVGQDDAAL
jgi:hypothetical protein